MNEWLFLQVYLSCNMLSGEGSPPWGFSPLYLKQVIKTPTHSTTVSPTAVYLKFKKVQLIFLSTFP